MKRLVLFTWLLATISNFSLFAQSKIENKNNFFYAESCILFEDYKEALPLYQQLLKIYPANSNYKYRIGQCYINTPGSKGRAISYLEDAVKNINPKYKEGKFRETGAPYDALYYLANSYRINNELDKALETYKLFKKNLNIEVYDSNIVNMQIQSCLNAKELMSMPLYVKEKNLGEIINESNSEYNPVINDKEDMLVFSRSEAFYDAILYSTKVNGKWTGPINMNELLKVDRDIFPTSISKDGKTLYLYSSADFDGIIYTSRFVNGSWAPIVKLNDNINTKYWESHATISHDNKKLYFTSNRKGTLGGLDIYVSKRDSTGDWGPAVNLGPVINTPYNEESPFLSADDKTLFFSSRGHFNMGGYDIFSSTLLDNGEWSVPVNAGYPMNTTDDDVFFNPVNEGYEGYYAKDSRNGFGKQDIYRIEIFSDKHPRKFFVSGMVKVADLNYNISDSVKISAMNIKNPNQNLIVYSNPKTGEYEFLLPQGNYKLTYEDAGGQKAVKDLVLPINNPSDSFILPGTILQKTDFNADLNVQSNKTITVVNGDTIVFPLKVEPRSVLSVEHWVGDSLFSSKQFKITDSTFTYKMSPKPGDNRLLFKLTDRYNNSSTTEVYITRKQNIVQPLIRPEYGTVLAKKQTDAFLSSLRNRAKDKVKKLLEAIDVSNQQFEKVDDLLSYVKGEASKNNINAEDIDRVALKVAALDNILSQGAVNYLAIDIEGELKKVLSELDIYKANLKTWTDFQSYVQTMTGGKITPEDLNKITASVLTDIDPSIALLKEKVLAYGEGTDAEPIIRRSVTEVDKMKIKIKEKWLQAFYKEANKQGLQENQLSDMLVTISAVPDTEVEQFLRDLTEMSEEPLLSSLKALDLKKENIKTTKELLYFLLTNKDKAKYPEEAIYKAISNLTVVKNIPTITITGRAAVTKKDHTWILWILLGTGLCLVLLIFWKRSKNKKK